jgi:SAM-dependent methyltransferase
MSARLKAGYYSPEDQYEATVEQFVTGDSSWLDVGCGRAPFPNNLELAADLSRRCDRFVGIDPDSSVNENRFVHERYQLRLDQYYPDCTFDLVTARMVVEHLADPSGFIRDLSRITKTGSAVIIFTVDWWSLTTLAAHLSPLFMHHGVKRLLWNTSRRDTFPTEYRLNRLQTLSSAMIDAGFHEYHCRVLPDASLFWRVPLLRTIELNCFRLFKQLRIPYFDSCILAIYQRCG